MKEPPSHPFRSKDYWYAALAECAFWIVLVTLWTPPLWACFAILAWGFCRFHLGMVQERIYQARREWYAAQLNEPNLMRGDDGTV
jgi:Flp pilus assembly protein TadB